MRPRLRASAAHRLRRRTAFQEEEGSLLTPARLCALHNRPHHDAAREGHSLAVEVEALAVLVRPRRTYGGPDRPGSVADDAVKAVGRFAAQERGLLLGIGLSSRSAADRSAASWGAVGAGHRGGGQTPRAARRRSKLHGAERRKRRWVDRGRARFTTLIQRSRRWPRSREGMCQGASHQRG